MQKQLKYVIGGIVLVIIIAGIYFFSQGGVGPSIPTRSFEKDEILAGNFSVPAGTKVVVKNGATLTVNGDLLVQGLLACQGGPLKLVVNGTFIVERTVQCDRANELPGDDPAIGISVVAQNFDIRKEAVVATNGHVQMVTNAGFLALSKAALDTLYEEAATYREDKVHIGPLAPLEQIPKNAPGRPVSFKFPSVAASVAPTALPASESVRSILIPVARAQEPAKDIEGNPVPATVKVGGTWLVGNPGQNPPVNLKVPTPPKGVSKIIVYFNFGNNGVNLVDFTLTGPDGRPGTPDHSCNAQGGKGEDAMRLLVTAQNIVVNNFNLHLGSGGEGGAATTPDNCDPAKAKGGEGGLAGNFKMIADEKFSIEGSFDLYPGKGGAGGEGTATAKKGEDGCAGEKGGDADATGGKGGNNNKLLVVTGSITGKENITIHEMVGGLGGDANANGGAGGNGTGPACNGGPGGKATATGGDGGNTTCSKFPCIGGDGGDATAEPGMGGRGGQGSEKDPGGNGGAGGDAKGAGGTGGTGVTKQGDPGEVLGETGGTGGDGGDGCGPGKGGPGGTGNPNGQKGADGKNLCPPINVNTNAVTDTNANTNENANTNTNANQNTNQNTNVDSFFDVFFEISGPIKFKHFIGESSCPQNAGTIRVTGENIPANSTLRVDASSVPQWLTVSAGGQLSATVLFNCNIERLETQTLNANVKTSVVGGDGKVLQSFTTQVTADIQAQQ